MDDLLQIAEGFTNAHLSAFVEEGGKVLGVSCVATPRELLDAAGVLPYRIRALGSPARDLADAHLSRFNCSYCRACLQQGLDGSLDFLDGFIETNGCDHLRGMFENWQGAGAPRFFHYLRVPHVINDDSLDVFADELRLLREQLQQQYEVELSDEDLLRAMERQNRIRQRLEELQALRERPHPALSGAEALAVMLAESSVPPAAFEELLERFVRGRRHHRVGDVRARLLLAGSATDEVELVRQVESLGALVVTDALCYGSKVSWRLPTSAGAADDPLVALAEAYLTHLLCPRMFAQFNMRRDAVLEAARRAGVHGAILIHNKFCDLHGVENVNLRKSLEQRGVPVLLLEKEYAAAADMGRIQTRVQAFLERIGKD